MGVIKFTFVMSILVGFSAVLLQKYSPETIDSVISDPRIQHYAIVANTYMEDFQLKITKTIRNNFPDLRRKWNELTFFINSKLGKKNTLLNEKPDPNAKINAEIHKKIHKDRVLSITELKMYDGKPGSKGLYLALMGLVFNVKKGKAHYGPGGGYEFFSGRDASRAFVTGNFDEEGLTDDVRGLAMQDYLGLKDWQQFYHKDYKYVGKLAGRYFTDDGVATAYKEQADRWIQDAVADRVKEEGEKKVFPPCNSEWSQEKGTRVWCTTKSGGVERTWVGVPRRLFTPGSPKARCACVKNSGPPTLGSLTGGDKGDLEHPHVKEYPGCDPEDHECDIGKVN